jgi:hypothetical protein
MSTSVTLSGVLFQDTDFEDYGYTEDIVVNGATYKRFLGLHAAAMGDYGTAVRSYVSGISIAIATASTHQFVIETDRPFTLGGFVMITDASVTSRYVFGQVNSYVASSRTITVSTIVAGGTGTIVNANIQIAGQRGAAGVGAPSPGAGDSLKLVRSNAGETALEFTDLDGASILPYGDYAMPVTAGAILSAASAGCTSVSAVQLGAQKEDVAYVEFDPATKQTGIFTVVVPEGVDPSANVNLKNVYWSHASTVASVGVAGVALSFRALARGAGDAFGGVSYGASTVVTDTGITTNTAHVIAGASAMVPGGTWASGDELAWKISREVSHAGDTNPNPIRVHGFQLVFSVQGTDE